MKEEILKERAKAEYKDACPETKKKLVSIFGEDCFVENIMERVKTFEDACDVLGIEPCEILSLSKTKDGITYEKLKVIARALNQGWVPNWSDTNERKWHPWFNATGSSGFGFSASGYDHWYSATCAGSRLCFISEALANYAGRQFESVYKEFMM